ncbi:MAG: hypothetical protein KA914_11610 [Ottowia sp.]|nr:hypothetical protein [Ottowia sp.]
MSADTSPPSSSSRIDVRTLSLAQLQQLAAKGSRRARAELEGRMRAAPPPPPPRSPPASPQRRASNAAAAPAARGPSEVDGAHALAAPRRPPANPPVLTERAHINTVAAAALAARQPSAAPGAGTADPRPLDDALQARLALMARQEDAASRVSGPPRLVGMVMIGWGALLVLGGLVMLAHGGGLYYLFCGLGAAGVGWLLMQCSRWAMVAHGVLLLVALAWAWRSEDVPSLGLTLVQASPLWVAALWMAIRPVREGLD